MLFWKRMFIRYSIGLLICLLIIFSNVILADDCDIQHDLFVKFLNISNSDCIFVTTMNGKTMLIDTGCKNSINQINQTIKNTKIDYLIGTIPYEEYIGSMAQFIKEHNIEKIYLPKISINSKYGNEISFVVKNKNMNINELKRGAGFNLDKDIKIEFLAPDDTNILQKSVFIKISHKNFSYLILRGLKGITQQEISDFGDKLNAKVVNLSSYDDISFISNSFFQPVRPLYTIISGNSEDFSYDSVLKGILESCDTDIFRIGRDGWVSIDTDGSYSAPFTEHLFQRCDPKDQITILTSSILSNNSGQYGHQNIWDRDPSTAWVEGINGEGIGEWIEFWLYRKKQIINSISIINGYAKNEAIYKANNRVKKVRISFMNGISYLFELKDNELQKQVLNLPKSIEASTIRISIVDIYKGSKYNDTCISEVEFN